MTDETELARARREVEALKGFYIHLLAFVCVMSGLVGLNMILRDGWWVQWPLIGWGIGLIAHALAVFMPFSLFGAAWTERKIQERLGRR